VNDDVDLVQAVAAAALAWSPEAPSTEGFDQQWRQLPLEWRALLAMVALAASDRALSANSVARSGRFSRGTAYTKKRDDMEMLTAAVPLVVQALLEPTKASPSLADLQTERQALHQTITQLREQLDNAAGQIDALASYAAELHRALKPEHEENLRTRAERVVEMGPRLRPVPTPPDLDPA